MEKLLKYLMLLLVTTLSLTLASCGGDDDEPDQPDNPNNGNVSNSASIATIDVKEVKLFERASVSDAPIETIQKNGIILYDSFNFRYYLILMNGKLQIRPYHREQGQYVVWARFVAWSYGQSGGYNGAYLNSNGTVSGINEVSSFNTHFSVRSSFPKIGESFAQSIDIQPSLGMSGCIWTENEKWQFIRFYVKEYNLDSTGTITSATIQYQLFTPNNIDAIL